MLSTIKILQAKNASTGTISMSKRLMAIQETFSTNLGPNPPPGQPLSLTRNGDVNKNQKCETNSSGSLPTPAPPATSASPAAPAAPVAPAAPAAPAAAAGPVPPSSQNGWKPSPVVGPPGPLAPASGPACGPCKPNSLILVPHLPHHQVPGQRCNGQVRLVSQTVRQAVRQSAVEVQTEESPPGHLADCPFNINKAEFQWARLLGT